MAVLHDFLSANRTALIDRCRSKAAQRSASGTRDADAEQVPLFLDQIIKTLQIEQTPERCRSRKVSGPAGGGKPVLSEIGASAARHGLESFRHRSSIEQVVHGYGDLCQAITDLAFELDAPVEIDEFRTLNRCLDNAIAHAVTEFSYQSEAASTRVAAEVLTERLGTFAHELRNLVNTATLALDAIKAGNVGVAGATGAVLDRSMTGLRSLIDRSLADVRLVTRPTARYELISLADLIAEVGASAALEARTRQCELFVSPVDPTLAVDCDRELLLAALGNLLQNAFKFTRRHTEVSLSAYGSASRILLDVEDHCGGLPEGDSEELFLPFAQGGTDRSGLGLGLSICRRNVEANGGILRVRDLPGSGCVFTIDLPRRALPLQPVE